MPKVKIMINTNLNLKDQSDTYQREVNSRLTNIKRTVEDLKEKTWKLDNNTRSNLIFYGIKEDGSCCNAEFAVKEVFEFVCDQLNVVNSCFVRLFAVSSQFHVICHS